MKQELNLIKYFILIFLSTYVGLTIAEDINGSNFVIENKHLELVYVDNSSAEDSAFEQNSSGSDFLLSREIANNQVIGMNYGAQEIESGLVNDDKSKLWLTLQLAF